MLMLHAVDVLRLVIVIILSTENLVKEFVGCQGCPKFYWDVPSKTCSDPFYSALQEITLMGQSIPDYVKYEKLCWRWEDTESCYQRLMDSCSESQEALRTIRDHVERHTIFTRPCRGWNLRRHNNASEPTNILDCFLPDISTLQSCVEAFDKQFRLSLQQETRKSACRVAVRTLTCLATIEDNLLTRCGKPVNPASSALNFRFIRPLLEETNPLLRSSGCLLPASLRERFIVANSACSPMLTSVFAMIICLAISQLDSVEQLRATTTRRLLHFHPKSTLNIASLARLELERQKLKNYEKLIKFRGFIEIKSPFTRASEAPSPSLNFLTFPKTYD